MDYDDSAIMYVGEAGLEYIDRYGDRRFISFEACGGKTSAQNCVARRMLRITQSGEIQHTIEFFTRTPTVFILESDDAFRRLCFRIEQLGWRVE